MGDGGWGVGGDAIPRMRSGGTDCRRIADGRRWTKSCAGDCHVAVGCMLQAVRGAVPCRLHVASCREAGCCIMHIALCSLKALRQHAIAPPPRGGSRKSAAESDAGAFSHPWLPPGPHAACAERRRVLRMLYDRCTGVRCRRMPKPFGGGRGGGRPSRSNPTTNHSPPKIASLLIARTFRLRAARALRLGRLLRLGQQARDAEACAPRARRHPVARGLRLRPDGRAG
jgi:hypothetical protein